MLRAFAFAIRVWPLPSRSCARLRSRRLTAAQQTRRFLYVAVPGAGNESEYRGVGILVYDIDNGHKFVKRIPTWPERAGQQPEHVRGIAASASARRLFVSTVKRLAAFDLVTEKIVWEKTYDGNLLRSPRAVTRRRDDLRACVRRAEVVRHRCRKRHAPGDDRRDGMAATGDFLARRCLRVL